MSKKAKFIIGGILIVVIVVVLFVTVSSQNITYYYTPAEVLQTPEKFKTRKIRVMGLVEPGSVKWNPQGPELRFRISEDEISYLDIFYQGAKPDMFREKQGIILEGTMDDTSVFTATVLLVKHNEEYKVQKDHDDKSDFYKTVQE